MFENKKTHNGIYYSRYIASWMNVGKDVRSPLFREWMRESEELTDDEINDIINMAINGKMELERSATYFLNNKVNSKD